MVASNLDAPRSLKRAISLAASELTPTLHPQNRIPKPKSRWTRTGRSIKLRIPLSQGRKYWRFHCWVAFVGVIFVDLSRVAEVRRGRRFGLRCWICLGLEVESGSFTAPMFQYFVGPPRHTLRRFQLLSGPTGLSFTTVDLSFHQRSVPCSLYSPRSRQSTIRSHRRSNTGLSTSSVSVLRRSMSLWRECRIWHGRMVAPTRASGGS